MATIQKNLDDNTQKLQQTGQSSFPQIGANKNPPQTPDNRIETPAISLPKGGGSIKSIDEKFSVNAVNGTASFSIPLPLSPGRGDLTPALGLSYNSGGGNSSCGIGWGLDVPMISRKTEKLLPTYEDGEEKDVFIFSGAEDLVPLLVQNEVSDNWEKHLTTLDDGSIITRYRPRIEGGFAKIERVQEGKYTWWKVTSPENVVSIFGKSSAARIANPQDDSQIFQWYLESTYNDKGSFAEYVYKAENLDEVPFSLAEKNRLNGNSPIANLYLKKVKYANVAPYYEGEDIPDRFLFELVLDYGEHNLDSPAPTEENHWTVRQDPFSSYRSGFDIRTYRLCHRVLMFHHFPEELGMEDYLVRSLDLTYDEHPHITYLEAITQSGYIWNDDGSLQSKQSFPPLEFHYYQPGFNTQIETISPENLANLPYGIDQKTYQWIDLFSEGVSGILTEQADGWYYKENLGDGQFALIKQVAPKPSFSGLTSSGLQIQDLEANGQKYLVSADSFVKGFFEMTPDEVWQPFTPFEKFPTIDLRDPNLKFLDLDGDGKADILITEEDIFRWYASLGKGGYDGHKIVPQAIDEEKGPRILFAEKDEKVLIALADMSGDGLSDILRITNTEAFYWPNLGYGRFGAKVTLAYEGEGDYWFSDNAELFNPQLIQLSDIDGSGTTDIIYLGNEKLKVWFNQSGNQLSSPSEIFNPFPKLDNQTSVSVVDLLGNGTSCIVWSSALPAYADSPIRYIDLMQGQKPHVMHQYINNLGKEVSLNYKPSTFFYLQDKKEGIPWITKLPFPVQCVEKVVVEDKVSQTRFTNSYTYHHGFYDHLEREFRGFAKVRQSDTEEYAHFVKETQANNAINTIEQALFQPAVFTITWFHTGAYLQEEHMQHQLSQEYYPQALLENGQLNEADLPDLWQTSFLPARSLPADLTTAERIEAHRSLKGLPLRQEIYSDEGEEAIQLHPYQVTQYNYEVQQLQPKAGQNYSVFFPHEKENITLHLERSPQDPRMAHSINLEIDSFGNVLQAASIVYGRLAEDPALPRATDREKQNERHILYSQNHYTNPNDEEQAYRLPALCETISWELEADNPQEELYAAGEMLNAFQAAMEIPYQDQTQTGQKRKIEHIRNVFLRDNLSGLLPLGHLENLALSGQSLQLAFTPELVPYLFGDKVNDDLLRNQAGYVRSEGDDNYWITSGHIHVYPDLSEDPFEKNLLPPTPADLEFARNNFYLPTVFEDNLGNLTKAFYDSHRLFIRHTVDPLDNETFIDQFHFRTLAPWLLRDANDNRQAVRFDAFGMVIQTFVMGKENEAFGDFIDLGSLESSALDEPGTSLSYEFRYWESESKFPNRVLAEAREAHHFDQNENGNPITPVWQQSYSYSDGSGNQVLVKVQAEPGEAPLRDQEGNLVFMDGELQSGDTGEELRWVGNGRTILNNKGNPVKQYEPFFDSSPEYNEEAELVEIGITPVLFYDALSRLIRTENPNSTFSRVEFTPWTQISWDANDTVIDSTWYTRRINGGLGEAERLAALQTELHDNTPTISHLDSLGRPSLSVAHNRTQRNGEALTEEFYHTRSFFDKEGNISRVQDARENIVMRWYYDMLGNVCRQESMDAGTGWQLNDAMGRALRSWDSRDHRFRVTYDNLHRPIASMVWDGQEERTVEQYQYGESFTDGDPKLLNLRGQVWRLFDTAGSVETLEVDFKGNMLRSRRTLLQDYHQVPDWANNPVLEEENFTSSTRLDALNRPVEMTLPDGSIVRPEYNEANFLNAMHARIRGEEAETTFVGNIDYDAKGQRERIVYGNRTLTRYDYEPDTYRLSRLLTTANQGQQILQDLSYTYDPVGNITRIFDNAQKTIFYGGQQVAAQNAYLYDALYRLVEATGREHIGQNNILPDDNWNGSWTQVNLQPNNPMQLRHFTQQYFYDGVGNMLRMRHIAGGANNWTRLFQYNPANNRLIQSSLGNTAYHYTYNPHGSMDTMPHLQQMDWNFKEELYHAGLGGGGEAWYVYDGNGQRIRKIIERQNGQIEERIYLGSVEIYRERQQGEITLERETLHVMDDTRRIAMVETRTLGTDSSPLQLQRYQYSDHLGSASLELDESGVVISYEEYHPFGTTSYQAVNSDIRAAAKRYRFTGMERDEESGLNYHGARYYAPWLGNWLSADPIGVGDGLNLYQYGFGDPIKFIDQGGTISSNFALIDPESRLGKAIRALGLLGAFQQGPKDPGAPQTPVKTRPVSPTEDPELGQSKEGSSNKKKAKNKSTDDVKRKQRPRGLDKDPFFRFDPPPTTKTISNDFGQNSRLEGKATIQSKKEKILSDAPTTVKSKPTTLAPEAENIKNLRQSAEAKGLKVRRQGGSSTIGAMTIIAISVGGTLLLTSSNRLEAAVNVATAIAEGMALDAALTAVTGSVKKGFILGTFIDMALMESDNPDFVKMKAEMKLIQGYIFENFEGVISKNEESFLGFKIGGDYIIEDRKRYDELYSQLELVVHNPTVLEKAHQKID